MSEPAFPTDPLRQVNGMMLRDYLAAKAMQGWFANPDPEVRAPIEVVAEQSYRMADAMMKVRTL